jgi:imidazole glycerol-phosphate synthase subunit HisH
MKIGIVDYGMGNLQSVRNSLNKLGFTSQIVHDPKDIEQCRLIILPGVGAFPEAMKQIKKLGIKEALDNHIKQSKPLIGICLGMQLLFSNSSEFGITEGLNYIEGHVYPFSDQIELRIPHMGWNDVISQNKAFSNFQGDYYFVHSFYCQPKNKSHIIFTSNYGINFCAAVRKNNIFGLQFHPEKSQDLGLSLLKEIISLC